MSTENNRDKDSKEESSSNFQNLNTEGPLNLTESINPLNSTENDTQIKKLVNEEKDDKNLKSKNSKEQHSQDKKQNKKGEEKEKKRNVAKYKYSNDEGLILKLNPQKEQKLREEVEETVREEERLQREYDEKYSLLNLSESNPEFKKILKSIEKKIIFIVIEGILLNINSSLIHFIFMKMRGDFSLVCFTLSIIYFTISIILFFLIKIGLMNSPESSKTFRVFIILECLVLLTTFSFHIVSSIQSFGYIINIRTISIKVGVYFLFILAFIMFIPAVAVASQLSAESILILINKKEEYSATILKELNNDKNNIDEKNKSNINQTKDELSLFDQKLYYKFYNFHASVSDRKEEIL